MKFAFKIVSGTMLIILVMFSLSGILFIHNHFQQAFELQMKINAAEFDLEKYSIETMLTEQLSADSTINQERLKDQLYTLSAYMGNSRKLYVAVNEQLVWGNLPFSIDPVTIQNGDMIEYENMHYALLCSRVKMNQETITVIGAYDISTLYEVRNRNLTYFYFIEILLLLICVVLISILAHYLTKPIQSLNEATKAVTSGDLDTVIPITSHDEVGELAASFVLMIEAIKKRQQELEQALKQRDDFIANFTHELKTPMTSIMGYTKILRQAKYTAADKEKALNYIYSETKRLELLSHRLLELMELSANRIELQKIDAYELLQEALQLAEERLMIKIHCKAEHAYVLGEHELLISCIINLFENAKKASDKEIYIALSGKAVTSGYQITVSDHGIGMAQSELKRIDESFYTIDKARSKKSGGYGLGLSLCTRILKLHHSELHIESEVGKGTDASFLLEIVYEEA